MSKVKIENISRYIESLGVTIKDGYLSDRVVIAISGEKVDGTIDLTGSFFDYYNQNNYYDKVFSISENQDIYDIDLESY